jgi:hypothetical protein
MTSRSPVRRSSQTFPRSVLPTSSSLSSLISSYLLHRLPFHPEDGDITDTACLILIANLLLDMFFDIENGAIISESVTERLPDYMMSHLKDITLHNHRCGNLKSSAEVLN